MGVPGLMAYVLKNYKKYILSKRLSVRPDWLYIDANCLFHPECFKILDAMRDEKDLGKLEEMMFRRILKYLDYIEGFVLPRQGMMIAVDGVAPRAKLGQQRKRRYRAIDDMVIKNNIKKKHSIPFNDLWNNTVITPGTDFMERLHEKLINHYRAKSIARSTQQSTQQSIKYMYSSYHTAGEGEHKILQYLKANTLKDINVIYGLDADLIFLALAARTPDIFLLREVTHFGMKKSDPELYDPVNDVAEEFMFVSIDETKRAYNDQIKQLIDNNRNRKANFQMNVDCDYSLDFVLTCFLLGNDFIAHFPSIDIHKGGLDNIIDAYVQCIVELEQMLISFVFESGKELVKINTIFLTRLFTILGARENEYFKFILPEYEDQKYRKRCFATTPYDRDMWMLDNMRTHVVFDPVKFGMGHQSEWKHRYYEHYSGASEHQSELVDSMCSLYIESVMWVARYYFESCPDWSWEYVHNTAPFISDVARYLESTNQDINYMTFTDQPPISIQKQLMIVLPPSCSHIVAKEYRRYIVDRSSPIVDMFPKKIKLDMLHKDLYWQCLPLLPPIDIQRINAVVDGLKLSAGETLRNRNESVFVFGKSR